MRAVSLALASLVCAAALSPVAGASTSAPSERAAAAPDTRIVLAANGCGHGWHWVPAGYAKRGKWRNGHCAPN